MRFRIGWLLLVAVIDLSSCASVQKVASTEPGDASGKQKTGLLHLNVDIAPPSSRANPDPIITKSTLHRIEMNEQNVGLDTLELICRCLKCELADLFFPEKD